MPAGLPKPGSFRWRVLEWLCRNGDGTVGELAAELAKVRRTLERVERRERVARFRRKRGRA